METALVLRGGQGVGKTKVGQVFGSLLGDHYALVAESRYVTGQFNAHMMALILLHADEAFWAGDKTAEGNLKDLVTGDTHFIEFKGIDPIRVRNYVRLFVTGNHDWQIPAGFGERRFAVLDVGEAHKGAISGSVRPPCTRWCSRWSASAWSAANRGWRAASRCSSPPKTCPSYAIPNPSNPLCRGTSGSSAVGTGILMLRLPGFDE